MNTHFMRRAVLACSLFLCGTGAVSAALAPATEPNDDPKKPVKQMEPAEIVDVTTAKVIKILEDPEFKQDEHKKELREKVRKILVEQVDMNTVSTLTLARYRNKFSDAQFKKFMETFERLLFATYIKHLEKYTNERIVVLETEKKTPTRAEVKTKTVTDTRDIPVDFSFIKLGKLWKLYDVQIEGVSLIRNYRSQFREILINSTAEELLKRLADKVVENEKNL